MPDIAHPLPYSLAMAAEALMADIPDREDTVFCLRRFMGEVYAAGHTDGRMLASAESYYDRHAPALASSAPATESGQA